MRRSLVTTSVLAAALALPLGCRQEQEAEKPTENTVAIHKTEQATRQSIYELFNIPKRRDAIVDTYHGVKVPDPYRWLEDEDHSDTKQWVTGQMEHSVQALDENPLFERFRTHFEKRWAYDSMGTPEQHGPFLYSWENDGKKPQSVLTRQKNVGDTKEVFLDSNILSNDGTTSVAETVFSPDGRFMAYLLSEKGSDTVTIRIRDCDTGKDMSDTLHLLMPTIAWKKDNSGFFYLSPTDPHVDIKERKPGALRVYFHQLGTEERADQVVFEQPKEPTTLPIPTVTHDGKYLIVHAFPGVDFSRNRIFIQSLEQKNATVQTLIDGNDSFFYYIANKGDTFYFQSTHNAPRGNLIAVDIKNPAPENWKVIIPQGKTTIAQGDILHVGGQFVVKSMERGHDILNVYDSQGESIRTIPLPDKGVIRNMTGQHDKNDLFFSFESHTYPRSVHRYNVTTEKSDTIFQPKVDFDPSKYETREVRYPSKDGTEISLTITCRKDTKLDGTNPTILYGYGGFGATIRPWFSIANTLWFEKGGVYAVAHIRGGGDEGTDWHHAGMRHNRQKTFDDFIAAAEYLQKEAYTSPKHLALKGGSHGGLLVSTCMTQRPDICQAVVCQVPVTDMLRYTKFGEFGNSQFYIPEYGDPENPEDFRVLFSYSPIHNTKAANYPAALITTGEKDERVPRLHSRKLTAVLQHAQTGPNPIYYHELTGSGHGHGKSTQKYIESTAREYTFLWQALKLTPPE